jgi:hypothetical protein
VGCTACAEPLGGPRNSASAGAPASTPTAAGVIPCDDIGPGIPPLDAEVDTVLDREGGRLTISYLDVATGQDRSFAIAYEADPDCRANPRLNQLIQHALDAG